MHHKLQYENKYPLQLVKNAINFIEHAIDPNALPSLVDLRAKMPPVYNQLQLGSCTANALVAVYQFDELSYYGSRLFLYYNERMLDNDVSQDAGSTLTQGINVLKKYGLCKETSWPYSDDATKYKIKPSQVCYTEALSHEVISANSIKQDLVSLKKCLASGFPFVLGIILYESFESDEVAQSGIVPMPQENEKTLGGHAIACVGYDDSKEMFIMRNSWGEDWGDKGYFYIPYNYLTNPDLANDFWEVTKVKL